MTSSTASAPADCKFCNRVGLPLLPLRLAFVPQGAQTLPPSLTQQPRVVAGLSQGHFALRVVTEGYVYVYDERVGGTWRCFGATPTGQMREFPIDAVAPVTPTFQCALKGHGDVASLISIENASQAGLVWIGYTRTMWTKAIRTKLKSNLGLRQSLMVKFNAAQVVTGGAVPPDVGLRVSSGADLLRLVPEYAKDTTAFAAVDRLYSSNTINAAVNRTGDADSLVARMHAISPGNAVILALPDTIGVTRDAGMWRNIQAGGLAKYQTEQALSGTRIVGDILLGIENALAKTSKTADWNEQYATHLDVARLHADKKAFDATVARLEKKIISASDDWHLCASSALFAQAWLIYDGADKQCGLAMERDFAHCVSGSGGTRKEQSWWDTWLAAAPDDEKHPLWIALAAGDKSLIEYLLHDPAKTFDAGKSDKLVDGTRATREGFKEFEEWRHEHRHHGALREAGVESGVLSNVVASQLSRVAAKNAQLALVVGTRIRVIVATRMDVAIVPHRIEMSVEQLVVELHETVWGPPTAKLSKTVLDARRLKIAQSVEGAWLGTRATAAQMVALDIWVPEEVAKLSHAAPLRLPAMPGMLALPAPADNVWSGFFKYAKGTGGVLALLFGALQLCNLTSVIVETKHVMKGNLGNKDAAREEAMYGITSGVLGVSSVVAEVVANVAQKRILAYTAVTTAARLGAIAAWSSLAGGLLTMASAWTEGIQLWQKSSELGSEGNSEASSAYRAASASLMLAGTASAIVTVIGAGTLLSAAGATGAFATAVISAGGVLACIPVAGWIAIAVGALAAALYFMYRGLRAEDTPLQRWMARGTYRNPKYKGKLEEFKSTAEEIADFQLAMYGLHVALDWDSSWIGKDEIDVEITMPGFGKSSEYAYLLELYGKSWHTPISQHSSAFSTDQDLQPKVTQAYFSAVDPKKKLVPMEEVLEIVEPMALHIEGGTAVLKGKIKANDAYYSKARLKFEYWPDPVNFPDLKMTPIPGGVNFAETGK